MITVVQLEGAFNCKQSVGSAWSGQTVEDSQYYDEGRDSWNQDPSEAAGEETYSFEHEGLGYMAMAICD